MTPEAAPRRTAPLRIVVAGLLAVAASSTTWALTGSDIAADWVIVGTPGDDTKTLVLSVADPVFPSALDPDDIDLDITETSNAVLVRIGVPHRDDNVGCKASLVAHTVTVDLTQPLGDRSIMDSRLDPPRPAVVSDVPLGGAALTPGP